MRATPWTGNRKGAAEGLKEVLDDMREWEMEQRDRNDDPRCDFCERTDAGCRCCCPCVSFLGDQLGHNVDRLRQLLLEYYQAHHNSEQDCELLLTKVDRIWKECQEKQELERVKIASRQQPNRHRRRAHDMKRELFTSFLFALYRDRFSQWWWMATTDDDKDDDVFEVLGVAEINHLIDTVEKQSGRSMSHWQDYQRSTPPPPPPTLGAFVPAELFTIGKKGELDAPTDNIGLYCPFCVVDNNTLK